MRYDVTFREVIPTYWTVQVEASSEAEARKLAEAALDKAIGAGEYEPEPVGQETREIFEVDPVRPGLEVSPTCLTFDDHDLVMDLENEAYYCRRCHWVQVG